MFIITHARKCCSGYNKPRRLPIELIWMAPRVSIWMARQSLLSLRIFNDFDLRGLRSGVESLLFRILFCGGTLVFFKHFAGSPVVFFADQNKVAPHGRRI